MQKTANQRLDELGGENGAAPKLEPGEELPEMFIERHPPAAVVVEVGEDQPMEESVPQEAHPIDPPETRIPTFAPVIEPHQNAPKYD